MSSKAPCQDSAPALMSEPMPQAPKHSKLGDAVSPQRPRPPPPPSMQNLLDFSFVPPSERNPRLSQSRLSPGLQDANADHLRSSGENCDPASRQRTGPRRQSVTQQRSRV